MHILMPAFEFPPFGAAGSMRLGRFADFFTRQGAKVTVVTAAVEDYEHGFPKPRPIDRKVLNSLSKEIDIVRAPPVRGLRTGSYSIDKIHVWNDVAKRLAESVHKLTPVDLVYTSANPLSAHLLGRDLATLFNAKWLAEFRDPWTNSPFKEWESRRAYRLEVDIHRNILKHCDRVIMNTPVAASNLGNEFPEETAGKIIVVTNSYSKNAICTVSTCNSSDWDGVLKIAHVGTLRKVYRQDSLVRRFKTFIKGIRDARHFRPRRFRLCKTNVFGNSLEYFSQAFKFLIDEDVQWRDRLRLTCVGMVAGGDAQAQFSRLNAKYDLHGSVEYEGMVSHDKASAIQAKADVLLVNQEYPLDGRPCPIVPAKIYEYLACGKPVLGLVPTGDSRDFLLRSGVGWVCAPDDYVAIAAKIKELYGLRTRGFIDLKPDWKFIEGFEVQALAQRVYDEMLRVLH